MQISLRSPHTHIIRTHQQTSARKEIFYSPKNSSHSELTTKLNFRYLQLICISYDSIKVIIQHCGCRVLGPSSLLFCSPSLPLFRNVDGYRLSELSLDVFYHRQLICLPNEKSSFAKMKMFNSKRCRGHDTDDEDEDDYYDDDDDDDDDAETIKIMFYDGI